MKRTEIPMRPDARFLMMAPLPAVSILVVAVRPAVWHLHNIVALVVILGAVVLLTLARWQLGNAFSVTPEATTLVTQGVYSRIRNPIYVFSAAMLAGLILYVGRPELLVLLIPVACAQVVRARLEARALEARFGDAYREYRAQTWF